MSSFASVARPVCSTLMALVLAAGPVLADPVDSGSSGSEHWPSFRGHLARGVADGHPTPVAWSVESGANVRWKTPVPGLSHSSPVIWGDRIFVTTAVKKGGRAHLKVGLYGSATPEPDEGVHKFQVYCLDKTTGEVIWVRTSIERAPLMKRHPKGSHAASSPATDGKRVVAFFASEGMYCYDLDGQLLWTKDFGPLDSGWYAARGAQFGFASSPVVHEGRLYLQCDVQEDSSICALNLEDGSVVWQTPRQDVPSWSSPTVDVSGGRRQVIVNGYKHMGGYDLDTGKELWKLSGGGDVPVPTPVVHDGIVYITNGHGRWNPVYGIDVRAEGEIADGFDAEGEPHVVWSQTRGGNYMQTPLVYRGHLYVCTDSGVLTCIDLKTGEHLKRARLGEGRDGFTASPVAADGKIYFTSEEGDVYVVKAGPELEVLQVNATNEMCMATPAISKGTLYFRTRSHLVAISGDEPVAKEEAVAVDDKEESAEIAVDTEPAAEETAKGYEGDLPDAAALFAGHIRARGGEEAYRAHSSLHMAGTFSMPSIGLKGKLVEHRRAPHFYRNSTNFPGMGETVTGYDGELAWIVSPQTGPLILSGAQLDGMRDEADLYRDLDYEDRYSKMDTVDRVDFHGHDAWLVQATETSGRESKMYFEVESGLLVGSDRVTDSLMGPMQIISVLEEYRDQAGFKMPLKTRTIMPSQSIEFLVEIDKISFEALADEVFAIPDEIQALRSENQ